jgi:hypothetical protein
MTTHENILNTLALRALLAGFALGACWLGSHATLAWYAHMGAALARLTGVS